MASEGKVRGFFRFSRAQSADEIPRIQTGLFYIVVLENNWNTPSARAFKNNKDAFINEIGSHLLVEPITDSQKDELRGIFNSEEKLEPLLIVCQDHPLEWPTSLKNNRGLKISLAHFKNEDSILKVLNFIVKEINSQEFVNKLKWQDRITYLHEKLKKIPIVDLVSVFS